MDLNESQLTTVLQEALTCYLSFLSHEQTVRERELPHKGKGVETSADISIREYHHIRVVATEACLYWAEKISARVLRWSNDPGYNLNDETIHIEPQTKQFEAFLEEEGIPILDPFTGAWIQPISLFAAGSADKDGGTSRRTESPKIFQEKIKPLKSIPVEEKVVKAPEVEQIRPIFRSSTRPSLGIHPNAPLSISCVSIEKDPVFKSSATHITPLITPQPSAATEDDSDGEEVSTSESEKEREINQHTKYLTSDPGGSEDSENNSEGCEEDKISIASEIASGFYLQKGVKDIAQVQKRYAEDSARREEALRYQKNAERNAARAQETKTRLADQEAYAKKLEHAERVRAEQVTKDRETAQQAQARWKLETLAHQTEAMRIEERRRIEDEEQRRLRHERRRKSRLSEYSKGRNYVSQEEAKPSEHSKSRRDRVSKDEATVRGDSRRRHSDKDYERRHSQIRSSSPSTTNLVSSLKKARFTDRPPSKKRYSSSVFNRSESTQKAESIPDDDQPRRASLPRKVDHPKKTESPIKDVPKQVDCVSCMEPLDKKTTIDLDCQHMYCSDCIKEAFKTAYKSHTSFKCCGKAIPATDITVLSTSFKHKYTLLLLELNTPSPKFCSSNRCSAFLPPSSIHGPLGFCGECKTRTCIPCGKPEHSGVCKKDTEGKKLEELAKKRGWKQCPNCAQILERTYGCLHMTCRCGANWCYACLRNWNVCGSSCSRSEPNGGYAMPPPMVDDLWPGWADFPPPPPPRVAGRPRDGHPAMNFGAALADRIGTNVHVHHNRATGQQNMRAEGGRGVIPVIATAVLMALMRD